MDASVLIWWADTHFIHIHTYSGCEHTAALSLSLSLSVQTPLFCSLSFLLLFFFFVRRPSVEESHHPEQEQMAYS